MYKNFLMLSLVFILSLSSNAVFASDAEKGKKYTASRGQRLKTLTFVMSNSIDISFPKLEKEQVYMYQVFMKVIIILLLILNLNLIECLKETKYLELYNLLLKKKNIQNFLI